MNERSWLEIEPAFFIVHKMIEHGFISDSKDL